MQRVFVDRAHLLRSYPRPVLSAPAPRVALPASLGSRARGRSRRRSTICIQPRTPLHPRISIRPWPTCPRTMVSNHRPSRTKRHNFCLQRSQYCESPESQVSTIKTTMYVTLIRWLIEISECVCWGGGEGFPHKRNGKTLMNERRSMHRLTGGSWHRRPSRIRSERCCQ